MKDHDMATEHTKAAQELINQGKEHMVALYHITQKLHALACKTECTEDAIATGKVMRMVSEAKDEALKLHGSFGGVALGPGGT